jgi:hypothetical protein
MTSELPSSAVGITISPTPEGRKLVGTKERIGEKKLFALLKKNKPIKGTV